MKGDKKLKGEWKRKSGAVWESKNGDRIHVLGVISKGKRVVTQDIQSSVLYFKCMDIMGQNNKRALMLVCEKSKGN